MNRSAAEIIREYGSFPGVDNVHGVTYDGQQVWFAAGDSVSWELATRERPEGDSHGGHGGSGRRV
jgi:hypothetical protein